MGSERYVKYPRGESLEVAEFWAYMRVRDTAQWFHYRTLAVFGTFIGLAQVRPDDSLGVAFMVLMMVSNVTIALFVRQKLLEAFPERAKVRALVPVLLCVVPFGTTLYALRFDKWLRKRLERAGVPGEFVSGKNLRKTVGRYLTDEAPDIMFWNEPPSGG